MGDTIEIIEQIATVLEVAGPAGPQGAQGATGSGLGTLTTQGDTLYQGASAAQRLPIGTAGQILKVNSGGTAPEWGAAPASGVSSVNGETGAVTLDAADVGAAATLHAGEHQDGEADQIMASAAIVQTEDASLNGIYVPDGTMVAGRLTYYRPGTRKNTKLEYNSQLSGYYLIKNTVTQASGQEENATSPWGQQYIDDRSPQVLSAGATVTQSSLEKLARSTTENLGTAALTDSTSFAASSHTHGNITNAGLVGTTSGLPLKTGTGGIVEAGAFGTAAGSFCAGDDARLSDARTPSSTLAHKASHSTGGTDALAPSDIGAQSLFASSSEVASADITLSASRAQRVRLENYNGTTYNVTLPTTDVRVGDVFIFTTGTLVGSQTIRRLNFSDNYSTLATISQGQSYRIISTGTTSGSWQIDPVFTHTHTVSDVTGAAASGSITTSGLTQATARILGRTSSSTGAVEEIQIGSGLSLSAGELSSTVSAGIPATILDAKGDLIVASAADTAARLAVGVTNGHVLTVDSAEATGMKWAAASGGIGGSTGATDNALLRSDGGGGSTAQPSDFVIDDYTATTQGNITIAPRAVSFSATIAASDDFVTATGHTFSNGDQVTFTSLTGGAGLTANTRYFVRDSATNVFKVATTVSGAAVDVTTNYTAATVERIAAVVINTRNVAPFIVGPKPDGTAVGGDARGLRAINIALSRDASTEVASGNDSIAIGTRSSASGSNSVAVGRLARANASFATAIGQSTNASGQQGTAIGTESSATGLASVAIGNSVTANATDAVAIGSYDANDTGSIATAIRCVGLNAIANMRGMLATRPFNAVYWGGQTTNNTATILNLDATATNRFTIAANTALAVDIYLVARRSDVADKWLVARRFLGIRRDGSNNTSLIGTVQDYGHDQSAGSPSWTFALTADDTNEALQLEVTGAASETVQWRATAFYRVV
jgi:hypothetical protein